MSEQNFVYSINSTAVILVGVIERGYLLKKFRYSN